MKAKFKCSNCGKTNLRVVRQTTEVWEDNQITETEDGDFIEVEIAPLPMSRKQSVVFVYYTCKGCSMSWHEPEEVPTINPKQKHD